MSLFPAAKCSIMYMVVAVRLEAGVSLAFQTPCDNDPQSTSATFAHSLGCAPFVPRAVVRVHEKHRKERVFGSHYIASLARLRDARWNLRWKG